MEIVKISIKDLKPYENNVKKHPREQIEQIKSSIKKFGNNDPIAVDENYVIIEGHGRYEALCDLGYKEAECIILKGLTEEQKDAYRLVHNKLTMNSDFELDGLIKELDKITTFDMSEFDFDLKELDKELSKINDEEREVKEDNYDFDKEVEPIVKRGQIWKLGNHRLMCGDSTSKEDVSKLCGRGKIDLIITDPPYNNDYQGKTNEKLKIKNDKMSQDNFYNFLLDTFKTLYEQVEEGCSIYIWHADIEGLCFRKAFQDSGWKLATCLIWNKNTFAFGRQDYQWKHEPCLYGWKEGKAHYFINDRTKTTILDFNKPNANKVHPTMKPID